MATFINYAYVGGSSGTSRQVNKPTNTASGDLMFAMLSGTSGYCNSVPSGWTLLAQETVSTSYRYELYYKVAGASEPSTYTWGFPSSSRSMVIVSTYRVTYVPLAITIISDTGYVTNNATLRAAAMTIPVSPIGDPTDLFYFGSVYATSSKTFTKPADIGANAWTEGMDYGNTSPDFWTTMGNLVMTTYGSTGDIDITCSETLTNKHAFAVAVFQNRGMFFPLLTN